MARQGRSRSQSVDVAATGRMDAGSDSAKYLAQYNVIKSNVAAAKAVELDLSQYPYLDAYMARTARHAGISHDTLAADIAADTRFNSASPSLKSSVETILLECCAAEISLQQQFAVTRARFHHDNQTRRFDQTYKALGASLAECQDNQALLLSKIDAEHALLLSGQQPGDGSTPSTALADVTARIRDLKTELAAKISDAKALLATIDQQCADAQKAYEQVVSLGITGSLIQTKKSQRDALQALKQDYITRVITPLDAVDSRNNLLADRSGAGEGHGASGAAVAPTGQLVALETFQEVYRANQSALDAAHTALDAGAFRDAAEVIEQYKRRARDNNMASFVDSAVAENKPRCDFSSAEVEAIKVTYDDAKTQYEALVRQSKTDPAKSGRLASNKQRLDAYKSKVNSLKWRYEQARQSYGLAFLRIQQPLRLVLNKCAGYAGQCTAVVENFVNAEAKIDGEKADANLVFAELNTLVASIHQVEAHIKASEQALNAFKNNPQHAEDLATLADATMRLHVQGREVSGTVTDFVAQAQNEIEDLKGLTEGLNSHYQRQIQSAYNAFILKHESGLHKTYAACERFFHQLDKRLTVDVSAISGSNAQVIQNAEGEADRQAYRDYVSSADDTLLPSRKQRIAEQIKTVKQHISIVQQQCGKTQNYVRALSKTPLVDQPGVKAKITKLQSRLAQSNRYFDALTLTQSALLEEQQRVRAAQQHRTTVKKDVLHVERQAAMWRAHKKQQSRFVCQTEFESMLDLGATLAYRSGIDGFSNCAKLTRETLFTGEMVEIARCQSGYESDYVALAKQGFLKFYNGDAGTDLSCVEVTQQGVTLQFSDEQKLSLESVIERDQGRKLSVLATVSDAIDKPRLLERMVKAVDMSLVTQPQGDLTARAGTEVVIDALPDWCIDVAGLVDGDAQVDEVQRDQAISDACQQVEDAFVALGYKGENIDLAPAVDMLKTKVANHALAKQRQIAKRRGSGTDETATAVSSSTDTEPGAAASHVRLGGSP